MITVVSGPPQGKFAQIPGTDYKTTVFIGVIHQFQSPYPSLTILKSDIIGVGILADVRKMAIDCIGDVDFIKGNTQGFTQNLGIGACTFGGTKARHGQSHDFLGITFQHFAGTYRHQQRQAAVQTTGNHHYGAPGMGVLHALGKALCLNAQNQLTAFCAAGGIQRYKRSRRNFTCQRELTGHHLKLHRSISFRLGNKRGVTLPLLNHTAQIQLCKRFLRCKRRSFGQHSTVFGNQIVPGKRHVGGAFAVPCIRIQITAKQAGTLTGYQLSPVRGFADGFIAGRKVGDHSSTRQSMGAAGRYRRPKIFTDLHPQHKGRHLFAGKQ